MQTLADFYETLLGLLTLSLAMNHFQLDLNFVAFIPLRKYTRVMLIFHPVNYFKVVQFNSTCCQVIQYNDLSVIYPLRVMGDGFAYFGNRYAFYD